MLSETDCELEEFNDEEAVRDLLKALTKVSVEVNQAERTCSEEKRSVIILIIAMYMAMQTVLSALFCHISIARWPRAHNCMYVARLATQLATHCVAGCTSYR